MLIGVDGNEANVKEKVGVSWYVFNLLKEFAKMADYKTRFRIFLRDKPDYSLPSESSYFKYCVIPGKFLWSQIFLPLTLFLKHRDLDVFLSPAHYAPRIAPCKTVVIIHDLSFFYYPQEFLKQDLYKLKNWTAYSVKQASKIIAVSQSTKLDLMSLYEVERDKIVVVYNGFSFNTRLAKLEKETVKKPYFLYIGTLQPRKNIINLILAFEKFRQHYSQYYLYLVGRKGWLYQDIFELVKKRKLAEWVIFTGYVNEREKQGLLKEASGLLVPGFYEGFGLPILEGFAAGVPVLAADSGALPEIGGEGCIYFNPTKTDEITTAMLSAVAGKFTTALKHKAKLRLKNFSWQKTALQILRVCR